VQLSQLTTILELVGLLLIIAAASIALGMLFAAAGLAVAGLGLLGLSWLIDYRANAAARAARVKAGGAA